MSTTSFNFQMLVNDPLAQIESAALGASTSALLTSNDIGKGVKLGTDQNFEPVAAGDQIEGFVTSVEPWTVNGGWSFGSVQRNRRMEAVTGADAVANNVTLGAFVVADASQPAVDTAGKTTVKIKTLAAADSFQWRVIWMDGDGTAAGQAVILERV